MVSSPKSSSIDYSRLPSSTTRDQAQSTTRISSSISTDHHQASSHTESDQEEEEAEEEDHHHHHHHQAQSTSFFNQQPPITHQDPSQQEPCPTSSFIISSIILLGLFFTFFLLAPTIYRLFHSIRPSTQIQPLDPHHPQTTHSSPSAESTTHETDHRPIRPATWNDHPLDSDRTLTQTRSNGTHQFNTTLILVSLDGFRILEKESHPKDDDDQRKVRHPGRLSQTSIPHLNVSKPLVDVDWIIPRITRDRG